MPFRFDADPAEQRQPRIAERRSLRHDEVAAEFDSGCAAGEDRRAVVE
jgi:hypothetical protein